MIRFPDETLADRAARLAPHFQVVLPEGEGPFPVCVMMHGCGKADGPQPGYARALAQAGVASLLVDSFAPRGIDRAQAVALVCSGLRLQGPRRAGDLAAALHWLGGEAWADAPRLAIAGWSHGGWTVMDAMTLGPSLGARAGLTDAGERAFDGVRHVFAVYPWCGVGARTIARGWVKPVETTIIVAGRDTVSGSVQPLAAAEAIRRCGASVHVEMFEAATHSFDELGVVDPRFRYDVELVERAHALCAARVGAALSA
jgi:dienelactone hydrolase